MLLPGYICVTLQIQNLYGSVIYNIRQLILLTLDSLYFGWPGFLAGRSVGREIIAIDMGLVFALSYCMHACIVSCYAYRYCYSFQYILACTIQLPMLQPQLALLVRTKGFEDLDPDPARIKLKKS